MNKRITKIKYKDDVSVEIHFEEKDGKSEKVSILKCFEKPHPDFDLAFGPLVSVVYDILQLPSDWRTGCVTVTGVSFSFSEDTNVEGAVITGRVKLETSNTPFNFNTPHLPFGQYSATGESPLMTDEGIEALDKLRKEANLYMTGKRAQLELPGVQGK